MTDLKPAVSNVFFYLIIGALYAFAMTCSIIGSTIIEIPAIYIFRCSAFFVCLMFVFFFNRRLLLICSTALFLSVVLFIRLNVTFNGFFSFTVNAGSRLESLITGARELLLFVRGALPYSDSFDKVTVITLAFVFALFVFVNIRIRFSFYFLSLTGFCVVLLPYALSFRRTEYPPLVFTFCFLVFLIKHRNGCPKEERTFKPFNAFFFLPLCLALCVIGMKLPQFDARALNFKTVNNAVKKAGDAVYTFFGPKYFTFSQTGFEGSGGELGGRVRLDDRFVMEVSANERVYLAGAVLETYTGRSWQTALTQTARLEKDSDGLYGLSGAMLGVCAAETDARAFFDAARTPEGAFFVSDVVKETDAVTINIKNAKTCSVFLPPNAVSVTFNGFDDSVYSSGQSLSAKVIMPADTSYTITYVKNFYGDKNQSDFQTFDLIRSMNALSSRFRPGEESSVKIVYGSGVLDILAQENYNAFFNLMLGFHNLTPYDLARNPSLWLAVNQTKTVAPADFSYVDYGYGDFEPYLALPESLPGRVFDLAFEITSKSDDTAFAKAQAVLDYLKRFSYTLSPQNVPKDAPDFVDYFLFEGKEGYCSYFASAMAVLLRCAGVPTRLVEGYVTPSKQSGGGVYTITNEQAHAWTEVFINGVWVLFEPTPPFAALMNERRASAENSHSPAVYDYESPYEKPVDDKAAVLNPARAQKAPAAKKTQINEISETLRFYLKIFLVIIGAVLIFAAVLGFLYLIWRVKLRKIELFNERDAVTAYFARILKACALFGYAKEANETADMYAGRLGDRFAFLNGAENMLTLARTFDKAAYSRLGATSRDVFIMKACYLEMLDRLRRYRFNKYTFFCYVYILNRV